MSLSPVLQARRQSDLLKKILSDNKEGLLDRMLLGMVQTGFTNMALDQLVAISDQGKIQRPKPEDFPEVMKADQVSDRIKELLGKYRQMNAMHNLSVRDINNAPRMFSKREIHRITGFLRARHTPHVQTAVARSGNDALEASTRPSVRCQSCDTGTRFIDWRSGVGYHFRCESCDTTEVIRVSCPQCCKRARVSKQGPTYSVVCKDCNLRTEYFTDQRLPPAGR